MGGADSVRSGFAARMAALPKLDRKMEASDTVTLGKTGIKTSRLAMGTGTVGVGHHSHQTDLGVAGLSALLLNGYDNGLRFFDAADSYGSHPHVAEALKHVPRDKVTVLTKTWARDPASASRSRSVSRGTGHGVSGRCADALRDRGRLDRAVSRRDGRAFGGEGEGDYSRARLLVPQHRGAAGGGEVAVGGGRSGARSIRSDRTWTPIRRRWLA